MIDDEEFFPRMGPELIEESRGKVYHFYLSGVIGNPENYVTMIHKIRSCGPSDLVYIHINTPGGDLFTVIQIIQAMNQCRGTVITCAEGDVSSGGSVIFFSGNAMEVGKFCSVMAHNVQGGAYGDFSEVAQRVSHIDSLYSRLCQEVYGKFLSKRELKSINGGGTVYLTGEETSQRIATAMKKLKKASK